MEVAFAEEVPLAAWVTWQTDEEVSGGLVRFGLAEETDRQTALYALPGTAQSVPLLGMKAGETYTIVPVSVNADGEAVPPPSFTTSADQ